LSNLSFIINQTIVNVVEATLTPNGIPIIQKILMVFGLFSLLTAFVHVMFKSGITVVVYIIATIKWIINLIFNKGEE